MSSKDFKPTATSDPYYGNSLRISQEHESMYIIHEDEKINLNDDSQNVMNKFNVDSGSKENVSNNYFEANSNSTASDNINKPLIDFESHPQWLFWQKYFPNYLEFCRNKDDLINDQQQVISNDFRVKLSNNLFINVTTKQEILSVDLKNLIQNLKVKYQSYNKSNEFEWKSYCKFLLELILCELRRRLDVHRK